MKKEIVITVLTLLILASPAFAAKPTNPGSHGSEISNEAKTTHGSSTSENQGNNGNNQSGNPTTQAVLGEVNDVITPTATPTPIQSGPTATPTVTPSVTPTVTEVDENDGGCDPNAHWKNHGAYVSCVAHLHPGGKVVSEAARSEIGKKHGEFEPSPTASPSPTIPPVTSATTLSGGVSPLSTIGSIIGKLFGFLKHLV